MFREFFCILYKSHLSEANAMFQDITIQFHNVCSLVVSKEQQGRCVFDCKDVLLKIKFPTHCLLLRCQSW